MRYRRHIWVLAALVGFAVGATAWAALTPVDSDSRERVYVIPKGTWARRMAGENIEVLPAEIRLTLGVKDVLVLQNQDDVPQLFGPVLIMPGQSFRLPFEVASTYSFACTAHASGQMSVIVDPGPARGWETLRWRMNDLMSRARWQTV